MFMYSKRTANPEKKFTNLKKVHKNEKVCDIEICYDLKKVHEFEKK